MARVPMWVDDAVAGSFKELARQHDLDPERFLERLMVLAGGVEHNSPLGVELAWWGEELELVTFWRERQPDERV